MDADKYIKFLENIKYYYNKRKNPFHNFLHGLTVMHGSFMIGCKTSAK